MDEIYNKIESIAAKSNGFVKSSQIEAAGISRGVIKNMFTAAYWNGADSGLIDYCNEFVGTVALLATAP